MNTQFVVKKRHQVHMHSEKNIRPGLNSPNIEKNDRGENKP